MMKRDFELLLIGRFLSAKGYLTVFAVGLVIGLIAGWLV